MYGNECLDFEGLENGPTCLRASPPECSQPTKYQWTLCNPEEIKMISYKKHNVSLCYENKNKINNFFFSKLMAQQAINAINAN